MIFEFNSWKTFEAVLDTGVAQMFILLDNAKYDVIHEE